MQIELSLEDLGVLVPLVPHSSPGLQNRLGTLWAAATLLDAGVDESDPRVALMLKSVGQMSTHEAATAPAAPQASTAPPSEEPAVDEEDKKIKLPSWKTSTIPLSPPFGWRVEDGKVIADRNEHLVMKYVLVNRKAGFTYQQLADDLNGRRLRNRKGKRWSSSAVTRVHKQSCAHAANTAWVNRWA